MVVGSRRWIDSATAHMIWDRELETAPPADVRALAEAAWQSQLAHLRENSAFHRPNLGSGDLRLADLAGLPFTTKEDLKRAIEANPPFGSNLCVPEAQVKRVYQTSGTTGAPSVLALTLADADVWTEIGTSSYYATGIHEEHSVLSTFGAGPFVAGHTHFVLLRIGSRVVPVGPGDTERVLFALRAGLVDTLLVTPSFAQYLANQSDPPQLAHVVTGGEPGGGIPEIRDHIQSALGAVVTEVMGIGDIAPSLFGECRHQQAIRARLTFRASVSLVPEAEFGDAGYKTRLTLRR